MYIQNIHFLSIRKTLNDDFLLHSFNFVEHGRMPKD